jgi:hypothetical protein
MREGKAMSKATARHLSRVRGLPCVLCALLGQQQATPTAAHHIREGQGMSQRADDFLTVALCHDCHQGPLGIHGNRSLLKIAKTTELLLLARTIEALS